MEKSEEFNRIYGRRANEMLETLSYLEKYMTDSAFSYNELVVKTSPPLRKTLDQTRFEKLVGCHNVAQILRKNAERINNNVGRGIHMNIKPGDISVLLEIEIPEIAPRGKDKREVVSKGGRVYTGQSVWSDQA